MLHWIEKAIPPFAVYVGDMPRALLPRDWVEIRSASEIVEGLDADGTLAGLPFMPEILPFAGRRLKVVQRAERTRVHPPQVPFPRLGNSVVLDGLRGDGSLHGGCQLGCMFFWSTYTVLELASMVAQVGLRKLRSVARSRRPAGPPTPPGAAPLDLKSGDWVEVKGVDEIVPTLDAQRQHKGRSAANMIEACGKKIWVERRVDTLIEERTGRLRTVTGAVLLEGSICDRYLGCARGMPFLWREIWLSRIDPPIFSDPSR